MTSTLKPETATSRAFRSEDFSGVKNLLSQNGLPTDDLSADSMRHFLVVETGSEIAACAGVEIFDGAALLRSLVVDENLRGLGVGKMLIDAIEALALLNNVAEIYLLTETAAPFFASLGYERIDRDLATLEIQETAEFSHLCPDSAVCMRKLV